MRSLLCFLFLVRFKQTYKKIAFVQYGKYTGKLLQYGKFTSEIASNMVSSIEKLLQYFLIKLYSSGFRRYLTILKNTTDYNMPSRKRTKTPTKKSKQLRTDWAANALLTKQQRKDLTLIKKQNRLKEKESKREEEESKREKKESKRIAKMQERLEKSGWYYGGDVNVFGWGGYIPVPKEHHVWEFTLVSIFLTSVVLFYLKDFGKDYYLGQKWILNTESLPHCHMLDGYLNLFGPIFGYTIGACVIYVLPLFRWATYLISISNMKSIVLSIILCYCIVASGMGLFRFNFLDFEEYESTESFVGFILSTVTLFVIIIGALNLHRYTSCTIKNIKMSMLMYCIGTPIFILFTDLYDNCRKEGCTGDRIASDILAGYVGLPIVIFLVIVYNTYHTYVWAETRKYMYTMYPNFMKAVDKFWELYYFYLLMFIVLLCGVHLFSSGSSSAGMCEWTKSKVVY